jgi:hypothetical protein
VDIGEIIELVTLIAGIIGAIAGVISSIHGRKADDAVVAAGNAMGGLATTVASAGGGLAQTVADAVADGLARTVAEATAATETFMGPAAQPVRHLADRVIAEAQRIGLPRDDN